MSKIQQYTIPDSWTPEGLSIPASLLSRLRGRRLLITLGGSLIPDEQGKNLQNIDRWYEVNTDGSVSFVGASFGVFLCGGFLPVPSPTTLPTHYDPTFSDELAEEDFSDMGFALFVNAEPDFLIQVQETWTPRVRTTDLKNLDWEAFDNEFIEWSLLRCSYLLTAGHDGKSVRLYGAGPVVPEELQGLGFYG